MLTRTQAMPPTDPVLVAVAKKDFALARRLLKKSPPAEAWEGLCLEASILYAEGQRDDAEQCLQRALREPGCGQRAWRDLASLMVLKGRHADALPYAKKAHELAPEDVDAGIMYANCLLDLARSDEVLPLAEHFLQINPSHRLFRLSKASALRSLGRPHESFLLLDEIAKDHPDDPVIMRMQADIIAERDSRAGIVLYDHALAKTLEKSGKTDIPLCWNMALHLLRTRDFERGWKYWEYGFHKEVGTMGRNLPGLLKEARRADLQDKFDTDKWTMVCVEQGIGDQVLFLSAMDQAIEEFKKVIFVCESRLAPIIKRSFPQLEVAQPGLIEAWNECGLPNNGFIPLGSILPRYRPTVDSFVERRRPFLQVDGDLYASYHRKLREIAQGRPIVGISWKGGYWENQKRNKALAIENWLPIFERGALCVNLQYGDTTPDQQFLAERGYEMLSFPALDFKKDLDHWLAIAAACDGIVSVSTALVHFAGACGQKVAVIMPEPQGPWILGTDDQWSIAYPEVLLFRRQHDEPVRNLIDRVAKVIVP